MVQIKQNNGLQGESVISAACSVGVMLCLVVTVLGIKFKWFKHRLTFSQTPSPNTRETATASSSAYPNDGNCMQGVFRCRDAESEEIERPKTLPPIRIRKTSSKTPRYSLPPPKKYNEEVSQEPPPPPPPPLPSIATPPIADVPMTKKPKTPQTKQRKHRPKSAANNIEAAASTEAVNNSKVASNKKVNFGNDSVEEIPPKPDRGKHFEKLKAERTSSNLSTKQAPPRRPTGFVRPQIDDLDIPENHDISERRPTGYVRPQIDDFTELDQSISVENSHDRIHTNSDSKIILKLDGFSDSEEKSEPVFEKIKNIPKPEPRSTIPQQVGILGSNENEDAWSAVQRHRNLTQEIAQHHIAVNMRAQIQNDEEEALAVKESMKNEKPRTMRDMRKSQAQASSKKERTIEGCNEDEAEA